MSKEAKKNGASFEKRINKKVRYKVRYRAALVRSGAAEEIQGVSGLNDQASKEAKKNGALFGKEIKKLRYRAALLQSGAAGEIQGVSGLNDQEPVDDTVLGEVADDVQGKALSLLGLIEEYFSATDGSSDIKQHLDWVQEADLGELLRKLEKSPDSQDEAKDTKEAVRGEIKLLLAIPDVKRKFLSVLKSESQRFRAARPTLKRVSKLKRLKEVILRKMTAMYLEDKRRTGKVQETTRMAINALEARRVQAEIQMDAERARADLHTISWLYVQELLGYKRELEERGFAITESRRALLDRVLSGVAHGEKILLIGSTGTGKTQLATLVADLVNDAGYEIVSWHEGTTPRDLFGYREIVQGTGGMKSQTKPGPVSLAIINGKVVIHDEYTTGSTRAQLAAKAQLNAKVGQRLHLPGFSGEVFEVQDGFGEIFTGNLRDERTREREEMDPAISRMFSGVKVGYMPSDELFKVVLAEMMDEIGFLPLTPQDVELIRKVTKAAELMQMCHDREVERLNASPNKEVIVQIFGGRTDEVHLDKNFLDTGTLLRMFNGWDLEKAKGRTFKEFFAQKLYEFLSDPKHDMDKQERQLVQKILELYGVIDTVCSVSLAPDDKDVCGEHDKGILPSEIARLFGVKPKYDVDLDEVPDETVTESQRRLLALLNSVEKNVTIENKIENQIAGALTLAALFEIGADDEPLPSAEQVKMALKVINPEQWKEIRKFKKPTLLVVPYPARFERYEQAINRPEVKQPCSASDAGFSGAAKGSFKNIVAGVKMSDSSARAFDAGKILGYRFVVTDGDSDMTDQGGNWNKAKIGVRTPKNQERINLFKAHFTPKSMTCLDAPAYLLLQMRAMGEGTPLDRTTFTMLEAVLEATYIGRYVACADWRIEKQAYFSAANLDDRYDFARLRPSVMGEIKT